MSNSSAALALRLQGPLQSWGFESQYNHRNTGLMPTKSALVGMCCAAMGISRGSPEESIVLSAFQRTRLLTVAVPARVATGTPTTRSVAGTRRAARSIRRIQDYHTVADTLKADGKVKDTHLTFRQYLCDAAYIAVFEGDRVFLGRVAAALANPVWGIWLGRKACIPSAPVLVLAGEMPLFADRDAAVHAALNGQSYTMFAHQEEVDGIEIDSDTIADTPLNFSTEHRQYQLRRIRRGAGRVEEDVTTE